MGKEVTQKVYRRRHPTHFVLCQDQQASLFNKVIACTVRLCTEERSLCLFGGFGDMTGRCRMQQADREPMIMSWDVIQETGVGRTVDALQEAKER